jgi:hypothetical protein
MVKDPKKGRKGMTNGFVRVVFATVLGLLIVPASGCDRKPAEKVFTFEIGDEGVRIEGTKSDDQFKVQVKSKGTNGGEGDER